MGIRISDYAWQLPFNAYSKLNALGGNDWSVISTCETNFSPSSFPLFLLFLLFIASLLPCFTCHSFLIPFSFLSFFLPSSNIPVSYTVTGHYLYMYIQLEHTYVWKSHIFGVKTRMFTELRVNLAYLQLDVEYRCHFLSLSTSVFPTFLKCLKISSFLYQICSHSCKPLGVKPINAIYELNN